MNPSRPLRSPHRPAPRSARSRAELAPWLALLAGPLLGTGYFWLVYLLGEAACAEQQTSQYPELVRGVGLVVAAVGGGLGWLAARGVQRWRTAPVVERSDEAENRGFVGFVAVLLVVMFVMFVAMVAAPTLGSQLC